MWPQGGRLTPLLAAMSLVQAACGDSTGPSIETIDVSPTSAVLAAIGDTVRFAAVARDSEGRAITDVEIFWFSSDPEVATVDQSSGLATAVANGSVTISARIPSLLGRTGTASLTVTPVVALSTVGALKVLEKNEDSLHTLEADPETSRRPPLHA